ncbi:MFS transporter [Vibrio intestinalis]|uniref:MFS transporter n=1 Tax=Vibrio intestinalis TaxID=2933291 RepID=UPI0021A72FA1|nr:MFS transporter [Vibrio intestinalis]
MSKHTLSPALMSLLFYTLFMVVGFTMLMPLVTVYFVNDLGMTAAVVGLALAVRQFTQQGLSVISGFIADRVGIKPLLLFGLLIRAFGFIFLAWATDTWQLFFGLCLSAIGGALFETPYQAAIIKLTTQEQRSHFYVLSNWVVGVGTTVGPLIGALLIDINFATVCYVAGGCFIVNFILAIKTIPNSLDNPEEAKDKSGKSDIWNKKNKPFFLFLILMTGYWFVSMQINITFPLFIEQITEDRSSVGIMFAVSALITVVLQYPLVKWMQKYCSDSSILIIGIALMSVACLSVAAFEQSYILFLTNVAIFSIGALLTRPTQQNLTASFAKSDAVASFIGISMLSLAIGGGLGNMVGGWLYDKAFLEQPPTFPQWLPWVCFALIGTICAIGMFYLFASQRDRAARHVTN